MNAGPPPHEKIAGEYVGCLHSDRPIVLEKRKKIKYLNPIPFDNLLKSFVKPTKPASALTRERLLPGSAIRQSIFICLDHYYRLKTPLWSAPLRFPISANRCPLSGGS
jgi:hypothetical protein